MCFVSMQGVFLPQVLSAMLANIANVLTNYTLVSWLDLGIV